MICFRKHFYISFYVVLLTFSFSCELFSQVIPIDSVRRQDTSGIPLLLGDTITVRGVVTMSGELGDYLVYFQDPTGGLVGYDAAFRSGTARGDSVEVTGKVTQYAGLTELQPVYSFTKLDTGKSVNPFVANTNTIRVNGETYEGRLIRINNIINVKNTNGVPVTQWTVTGSGTNYRIFDGIDSCEIRIYATTNIANSPVPPFPFSVVALGSQYKFSPPYNSGYQILPRALDDLITAGGGPLLSQITYANIQQTSVTITWISSTAADSKVRWMATDSNYQPILYRDSIYNAQLVTTHSVTLNNLRPGKIYDFNVTSANTMGSTTSPTQYFATKSTSSGTINVYFNRSVDTSLSIGEPAQGNVNFQTKLLQRINGAQYSIDMALYSFDNLTQIRDALINAKLRGVKIRFVYDSRTNQQLVSDLIAAGILIQKRNYQTSDIMHNKFFVFDYRDTSSSTDDWVWTGSTNITQQQFYTDGNNVIEIQDKTLAAIYTREFEEMWGNATEIPDPVRAKFGPSKPDILPHKVNVNGTPVEVYFSPSDNVSTQIENMIANYTDYDIYFCEYAFTKFSIANAMRSKWNAGKDVKGVFDNDTGGTGSGTIYREMKGLAGQIWTPPADVWLDAAEPGILHHKYMLIDAPYANSNPMTETGSYNLSNAATYNNDENILLVYSPRISNLYLQEFYKRYRISGGTGIIIIGVQQITSGIPKEHKLYQNYPNPFNTISRLKFQLSKTENVNLKMYDILGREVKTLMNESMRPGSYEILFDASNLASGIYFYSLFVDGVKIDSKKMVLVK